MTSASGQKVNNGVWGKTDWLIAAVLFFFLSAIYYATASGITSSNDGSHYALLRTIVENHSFELQQFDDYAEGNDIARTEDGRLFSDRPPGTALLGTLFYISGQAFAGIAQPLPSRHDESNTRLASVLMLPVFAGAATAVVLYALLRILELGQAASTMAVVAFGLGTIHWKYSSVLYSHALSSFLVIMAFFLAIFIVRHDRRRTPIFLLLGFLLGLAVLTEYSNVLLVVILSFYLLLALHRADRRWLLTAFGSLIAGGLVCALFLALYNQLNFGSPFKLSYSYAINYPWASSFTTTFNFPTIAGLRGLLVGGEGDGWCGGPCLNEGLFSLSPILLLALPGWILFYLGSRRECLLTAVIFLIYLLLFARHRTFHGFTADGRYLTPYLSLLAIPLAFFLQWTLNLRRQPWLRILLLAIATGLFLLSVGNIFVHIGTSYNYQLNPDLIGIGLLRPQNWSSALSQVFRNFANLGLLWFVEVGIVSIIGAAAFALHKSTNNLSS